MVRFQNDFASRSRLPTMSNSQLEKSAVVRTANKSENRGIIKSSVHSAFFEFEFK